MSLRDQLQKWLEMNNLKSFVEMCNLAFVQYDAVRKCWKENPDSLSLGNKFRLNNLTGLFPMTDKELDLYRKECEKNTWLKLAEIHSQQLIKQWKKDGSLPPSTLNQPKGVKALGVRQSIEMLYPNGIESQKGIPVYETIKSDVSDSVFSVLSTKKVDPELFALSLKMMNKLFTELLYSDEKHILSVVKSNTKQLDELTTVLNLVREESPHDKLKNSLKIKSLFNE
jgi:hypothetical protein